jgi:lambda family phage portal protein
MDKPKLNIIDRAIGFFNPESAVNRLKHRAALALSGSYNAGSMSRPALKNWNPHAGDANADTIYDLPMLRTRSRDLARNAPIGVAAINTVISNVIGTGLSMQCNPDAKYLGWTDEHANEWKAEVEAEWLLWCNSLDCDASRSMNFYGLQSLALRSMLESGDVLAITPAIKRSNPYSLTIQLIEADRVSNKNSAINSGNSISGVTIDDNGAPVSYSISKQHPGAVMRGGMEWVEVKAYGKNGRRNVLHLFDKRRPGQVRGVPYLAPVIEHLKQLARYSEAELQAAVVSAALAIFVKMDAEAFQTLFEGDSSATYLNNATGWDGTVSTDLDGPGKAINLLPGEDVSTPALGRPNVNYDPFFLSMLKQIGPALEIPFEVLIKHFSSSYSASRAALLDFWRIVRVRRDFMATQFCEPIKDLWFEEAVATGRITAPGFFADARVRQAYSRVQWIGDSPGSIDPEKEANAAISRMDAGITTLEIETVAYNGGDWEANHRQRAKEVGMRTADGLIVEQPARPTTPPQS